MVLFVACRFISARFAVLLNTGITPVSSYVHPLGPPLFPHRLRLAGVYQVKPDTQLREKSFDDILKFQKGLMATCLIVVRGLVWQAGPGWGGSKVRIKEHGACWISSQDCSGDNIGQPSGVLEPI